MILQIILIVLKVIGIILLCLLAFLLLLLICPIRYRADIRYHDDKPAVKGVITYFFRFLRVYADYPSDRILKIKVLFFTLNADKEDKNTDEETDKKKEPGKNEDKADEAPSEALENTKEEQTNKEEVSETTQDTTPETEKASESSENTGYQEEEAAETKEPLPERIRLTLEKICGKIESTVKAVEKTEDFLELPGTQNFLNVTKNAVIRMFRSMRPHISGKAVIGMEDPSTTGLICAVYGILSPYRSGKFDLDARFEEKIIDADVRIKGRIILMVFLVQALRILIFGHALKVKKNLNIVQKAWRKNVNE